MNPLFIFVIVFVVLIVFLYISSLVKENKKIAVLKSELYEANEVIKKLEPINARYYLSESDANKYKTDAAMISAIRTRLAMYIANEVIRKIGDPERICDGDRTKYEYNIKFYADNNSGAE